ncbi:MAG: hypothetical protein RIS64_2139 [Bacteroidota bacterium]|jgi:hypothetical protein
MKKLIDKNFFILLFISILCFGTFGCDRTGFTIQPACTDRVDCRLEFDPSFLGFCSKVHENGVKRDMIIEINVDGLNVNAAGQSVSIDNLLNATFFTNNEDLTNPSSQNFIIKLPMCGSYTVTAQVRGVDGSCFQCCTSQGGSLTFPTPNANCQSTIDIKKGAPKFREVVPKINSDLQHPPPSILPLNPQPQSCTVCRTNC